MRDDSAHRCEVTQEVLALLWLQQAAAYYRASRSSPAVAGGRADERESGPVVNAGMHSGHRGR